MSDSREPTFVEVEYGADMLDWERARRDLRRKLGRSPGQISRTSGRPDCTDECGEDCGHRYTMIYMTREP